MRGGAHVKEALGVVTLLWNHPVLTGLLLLIFTPPFFPLVVYFSPLLMSTALCVVALVSVGSQMEKIKAEGGPGQQLESHLGREHGVSRWVPPSHDQSIQDQRHRYAHRNLFNIDVIAPAAPTPWRHELPQLPVENDAPPTPPAEESEEDWWDNWVKEYESRPGWGEQEDQQPAPTPAIRPTTTSTIPTPRSQERNQDAPPMTPRKPETREEKASTAPSVVVSIAASVAAPVVNCRQEVVPRSLPPPPTPRNGHEKVVKDSDLRPHISLAPILTGKETRDARKAPEIAHEVARSVNVERVSEAQALQSIEKLLAGSNAASDVAQARNANSTKEMESETTGKGMAVDAAEKSRTKIAVAPPAPDVAGFAGESPPLLRHLKISQSEKAAYSPLPARASKGLMSEKVLPPPQFSPLLLQSLQPLPPKGFSPRLPNLSSVPLGNPVEKIPQWVYDGIPRERTEQAELAERAEEKKNIRAFEQAVRELSESRRKKNARRPSPIQVGLQPSTAEATLARIRKQRTPTSRVNPAMAAVEAETLPARISEDMDAPATAPSPRAFSPSAASPQQASVAASPRRAASRAASPQPAPIAASKSAALPQRVPNAASPRSSSPRPAPIAASPRPASPQPSAVSASPRALSLQPAAISASPRALSPQPAPPIAASPRPASPQPAPPIAASPRPASPHPAPIAASPRPSSPHPAPIAASPRPSSAGSSPQNALVAASPRRASRASSPHISSTPWPASTASSSSPQKPAPIAAASPRPPSMASSLADKSPAPASPSVPHPRRRRQSSKNCTDKVAFIRIEGSKYYDPPSAAEKEKLHLAEESPSEEYVPIEEEATPVAEDELIAESHCITPRASEPGIEEDASSIRWGRSYSATRKSRRRLEPRRVVTSADTDMFSLKKSFSTRTGETKKFVDSSSSSDDERESVTPRASSSRRSTKPLVWRSRSHHVQDAHEDSD